MAGAAWSSDARRLRQARFGSDPVLRDSPRLFGPGHLLC